MNLSNTLIYGPNATYRYPLPGGWDIRLPGIPQGLERGRRLAHARFHHTSDTFRISAIDGISWRSTVAFDRCAVGAQLANLFPLFLVSHPWYQSLCQTSSTFPPTCSSFVMCLLAIKPLYTYRYILHVHSCLSQTQVQVPSASAAVDVPGLSMLFTNSAIPDRVRHPLFQLPCFGISEYRCCRGSQLEAYQESYL